jgi:hypothetical protein
MQINHHSVDVEGTQEEIYELVSESKVSAWNGRFSLNDAVWQRLPLQKKNDLYLQIKNNRSFCINERDITKHFDELLIF